MLFQFSASSARVNENLSTVAVTSFPPLSFTRYGRPEVHVAIDRVRDRSGSHSTLAVGVQSHLSIHNALSRGLGADVDVRLSEAAEAFHPVDDGSSFSYGAGVENGLARFGFEEDTAMSVSL